MLVKFSVYVTDHQNMFSSVQFSRLVVSDSLRPHESQPYKQHRIKTSKSESLQFSCLHHIPTRGSLQMLESGPHECVQAPISGRLCDKRKMGTIAMVSSFLREKNPSQYPLSRCLSFSGWNQIIWTAIDAREAGIRRIWFCTTALVGSS